MTADFETPESLLSPWAWRKSSTPTISFATGASTTNNTTPDAGVTHANITNKDSGTCARSSDSTANSKNKKAGDDAKNN
jgi:hypothetical protein